MVRYACAQVARPVRWSASGTSRTSTRHSSATSCGSWSSRVGTVPPAQASASRVRVSGWPRPSAASRSRWSSGTPSRQSSSTLSAGGSTARSSRRSSCRQPGSADQPASGGSRPASTTTESAGSDGSRCSRNHRSSRVSSSYPSTSSTGPGPSGSAATAARDVLDGAAEVPAVQQQRRPLRLHRAAAQLVEQRGLADAAGTVHEQHPGRPGAGQRRGERPQFRSTADEASAAGVVEDGGEGRAHRSCSSQVRRSC